MSIGVFSMIAAPMAIPVAVHANVITNQVCAGVDAATNNTAIDVNSTTGQSDCATDNGNGNLQSILSLIINVFSIVVGFVAIVMIIYGGVKYITSGGESSNISGAKNTIIYALVGLVIVALAQVIVHFVLNKAATVSGTQ